jgi:hypothetical protein
MTTSAYRSDIDGLRAIAVLSVVAFHAFPSWVKGGFIGVDVFFVISGYLISTIIFENLDKGTFSFSEFYSRRIRRIFPALLLVLIACFAFGWFALLADEYKQLGKHIAAGAGFISNFILWNEAGYFDNSAETIQVKSRDLKNLVAKLNELDINQVFVEAGSTLASAMLTAGLLDELVIYQAPALLGSGKSFYEDGSNLTIEDQMRLEHISTEVLAGDVKSVYRIGVGD